MFDIKFQAFFLIKIWIFILKLFFIFLYNGIKNKFFKNIILIYF